MKIKSIFRGAVCAFAAACVAASCSTPKDITYFQGAQDAEIFEIAGLQPSQIKLQPHDKLSITVNCKDPALAQMFNLNVFTNSVSQKAGYSGTGSQYRNYDVGYSDGIQGFTVSPEGTIDYPVLGKIKVEGMTRSELAAFIKGEIMGRGLIKDPVVSVEFLNVGVSLMGEVVHPGRYDLNKDVLTIVEAISLAGDLSIYGKRQNVKVIRQNGNKVETFVVDLTDANKLVNSPAYYLQQGDIVYVEPNNIRKRQTIANGNSVTNISFWISIASLLTSAAILFKK